MRRGLIREAMVACAAMALLFVPRQVFADDAPRRTNETALDRYVAKPDPTYSYKLVRTIPGDGYTVAVIRMTSQTWLTPQEVDHPVWEHWMTVIRPEAVTSSTALLFLGGGSRNHRAPQ